MIPGSWARFAGGPVLVGSFAGFGRDSRPVFVTTATAFRERSTDPLRQLGKLGD
jgi:hypothetical protein